MAPDKPYFVYFATGAAHTPHHVSQEWIEKYRGKFDQGWDRLREEIFTRQKKMGVIPADAELTSRPQELPAWTSLSPEEQRLFARQMEIYAAFIAHTDYEIGRLIDTIRAAPNGDNTLIFYIVGDNGGAAPVLGGWENMSGHQPSIKERLKRIDELGSPKYMNEYAAGWAWAGSTPFQWMKQVASHFGATRNPLIVSWPARIRDKGGLRTQFTHVNDVAPTIYEVTGISMPDSVDGVKQQPLDGVSFAYTFEDADMPSLKYMQYFEVFGNRAIYKDGWMASARNSVPWVHQKDENFADDLWELYNIDKDFSQAKDVAETYPDKLKELQALFDREARSNNIYPLHTRFSYTSQPSKSRRQFVYHKGFPGVSTGVAPKFAGASFRIIANIVVPKTGADGVILAFGGRDGGFSLYVKDNRVVYESNYYGDIRAAICSPDPLPYGKVEVIYDYVHNENIPGGRGLLYVEGKQVGYAQFKHAIPSSLDNFDIAQDSGSPVSNGYDAPFSFTGSLEKVTVIFK